MERNQRIDIRVSANEKQDLLELAKGSGFSSISEFLRSQVLSKEKTLNKFQDIKENRMHARSIRLSSIIWDKINQKNERPSDFIRKAILEKLQNFSN